MLNLTVKVSANLGLGMVWTTAGLVTIVWCGNTSARQRNSRPSSPSFAENKVVGCLVFCIQYYAGVSSATSLHREPTVPLILSALFEGETAATKSCGTSVIVSTDAPYD